MRDILPELENWIEKGERVALATVVRTWGSSPRGVGAKMAFTADGKIVGSVSGGCVEGAVFQAGVESLESRQPQFLHFGVADETAWEVGLACGGQIDVFVQALNRDFFDHLRQALANERPFAVATVVRGPAGLAGREMLVAEGARAAGSLHPGLDETVVEKARAALLEGRSQVIALQTQKGEPLEVFIEAVNPPPALIVVGGVHSAIALTDIARTLGFRTIVIDPRSAFASAERFPRVDRLIQAWPQEAFQQITIHERTALAMLTHDPKIDDPALLIALRSPAFYIGALGSQTTQAKRRQRLLEAGLGEAELARLHGPIGLKLGAETPEEIALAIMAEIVAVQHGVVK
jgi:xanthine dehydrogenase accessory factor